jgi:hypothetical protein
MEPLLEENKTSGNEYNYKFLDSVKLEKNVDRVKFINNENGNVSEKYILSACYHLDKESGKKSGSLNLNKINLNIKSEHSVEENIPSEKILSKTLTYNFDYGIVDLKYTNTLNSRNDTSIETDYNSSGMKLFTTNSDYSFSIFKINFENTEKIENHPVIQPLKKYAIYNEEFKYNPKETCNALDIKTLNSDSSIILAMNDGCHCIFNLAKEKPISIKKSHEYGLWSCMIKDMTGHIFFTGSEDSLFKMWDRRTDQKAVGVNRTHNASINSIQNFLNDDNSNYIVTGSYDETLRIIDIRKFGECVYKKKLDCSIWDLNQLNFKGRGNLFLMACVYEGFNVFEFDPEKIILENNENDSSCIKNIFSFALEKEESIYKSLNHKTIVYGVDSTNFQSDDELYVTSCSFYDNTISFWKIF